jgi:hypothetical protein
MDWTGPPLGIVEPVPKSAQFPRPLARPERVVAAKMVGSNARCQ